ncbi:MAG TPA: serine--tRNA ligase, partial [Patescibacteria group bacterium]|nr:serine--tRNA ligase [Patescibacteria group bacterium]
LAKELIKEAQKIPEKLSSNEEEEKNLRKEMDYFLSMIPNIQADDVPAGGEEKNKVMKMEGKIPKFSFELKSHEELLENKNFLDMKRAAKLAGAGFYLFKGEFAEFERALINFMIDFHVKAGFTEINPPQLVNEQTMYGTGNLPKFEQDLYKTREGFYLIPTAEVVVTNIYANEILQEKDLPKKFVAFTQCYRTEAGRHGSETPGIFRLHEFEKVEMVYICKQEDSWKFHEEMTERAEKLLELLKLPYRRLLLATADAGFASAKTYDLEVWSPFLKKYLETSSCSNCTDFQARRMNTRYQDKGELKFAHTLNGSGLATPRLLIALVENYQQKDGSIKIPDVLVPYMKGKKFIGKSKPEKKLKEKRISRKKRGKN